MRYDNKGKILICPTMGPLNRSTDHVKTLDSDLTSPRHLSLIQPTVISEIVNADLNYYTHSAIPDLFQKPKEGYL